MIILKLKNERRKHKVESSNFSFVGVTKKIKKKTKTLPNIKSIPNYDEYIFVCMKMRNSKIRNANAVASVCTLYVYARADGKWEILPVKKKEEENYRIVQYANVQQVNTLALK